MTKKAASGGRKRPRRQSGDSHSSCSAKRKLLKEKVSSLSVRLAVIETMFERFQHEVQGPDDAKKE